MDFVYNTEQAELLLDLYTIENEASSIYKSSAMIEHMYLKTGVVEILEEGFSDIFGKMGEYFKRIIEAIKEFFKKILMYIESYLLDLDKFCKKYSDKLTNLDVEFEYDGYNFTVGKEPNMKPFEDIVNNYNKDVSKLSELTPDQIVKQSNDFFSYTNKTKIMQEISGVNIQTENKQLETIRAYYRDGKKDTVKLKINNSYIRNIVNTADKLSEDKEKAIELRDELIDLFSEAQDFFDKKAPTYYENGTNTMRTSNIDIKDNKFKTTNSNSVKYSDSNYATYNKLIKFKYEQTKFVGGIANMVASERVNAFKDHINQNRGILRQALSSSSKKDESTSESYIDRSIFEIVSESINNDLASTRPIITSIIEQCNSIEGISVVRKDLMNTIDYLKIMRNKVTKDSMKQDILYHISWLDDNCRYKINKKSLDIRNKTIQERMI